MNFENLEQAIMQVNLQTAETCRLAAETHRLAAEETLAKLKLETEQAALMLAIGKREIEYYKQHRRPSQERFAQIEFNSDKGLWAATSQGVVAYGDTPEMACDNFDHLWLFGDNDK